MADCPKRRSRRPARLLLSELADLYEYHYRMRAEGWSRWERKCVVNLCKLSTIMAFTVLPFTALPFNVLALNALAFNIFAFNVPAFSVRRIDPLPAGDLRQSLLSLQGPLTSIVVSKRSTTLLNLAY